MGAGADDHLDLAAAAGHRPAGQFLDFIRGEGRRLPGGAGDDDPVGAFARMEIQQIIPRRPVQTAVGGHRRHNRHHASGKHQGLRRKYRYLKWRTCTVASVHPVEFGPMKQHIVISAVGGDRVGMVHELSKAIADCGGSISESRMTSLGNEFAMLLLVNGNWHTLAKLEGEFKKLADATGMNIQLRRTEERAARNDMLPYSIDVVCLDQTGIVAGLSGFF